MLWEPAITYCDECFWDPGDLLFPSLVTSTGFGECDFYRISVRMHGLPVCVLKEQGFSCGILQGEWFLIVLQLLQNWIWGFSQKYDDDKWGISAGIQEGTCLFKWAAVAPGWDIGKRPDCVTGAFWTARYLERCCLWIRVCLMIWLNGWKVLSVFHNLLLKLGL